MRYERPCLIWLMLCMGVGVAWCQDQLVGESPPGWKYVKPKEYIQTDSAYIQGEVFPVNERTVRFRPGPDMNLVTYNADDVLEFTYEWKTYRSLTINGKRIFVRLIEPGDISLFKRKRMFLLIVEGKMIPFDRHNFHQVLESVDHCQIDQITDHLSYTIAAMSKWVEDLNGLGCGR